MQKVILYSAYYLSYLLPKNVICARRRFVPYAESRFVIIAAFREYTVKLKKYIMRRKC